mmetsp:Transcript_10620/g.41247  ORF Transcript_10620/g.41247 Transcript_10620/m.41247 type:complete len:347 (-) Transcript_10620:115-1155(-)
MACRRSRAMAPLDSPASPASCSASDVAAKVVLSRADVACTTAAALGPPPSPAACDAPRLRSSRGDTLASGAPAASAPIWAGDVPARPLGGVRTAAGSLGPSASAAAPASLSGASEDAAGSGPVGSADCPVRYCSARSCTDGLELTPPREPEARAPSAASSTGSDGLTVKSSAAPSGTLGVASSAMPSCRRPARMLATASRTLGASTLDLAALEAVPGREPARLPAVGTRYARRPGGPACSPRSRPSSTSAPALAALSPRLLSAIRSSGAAGAGGAGEPSSSRVAAAPAAAMLLGASSGRASLRGVMVIANASGGPNALPGVDGDDSDSPGSESSKSAREACEAAAA